MSYRLLDERQEKTGEPLLTPHRPEHDDGEDDTPVQGRVEWLATLYSRLAESHESPFRDDKRELRPEFVPCPGGRSVEKW